MKKNYELGKTYTFAKPFERGFITIPEGTNCVLTKIEGEMLTLGFEGLEELTFPMSYLDSFIVPVVKLDDDEDGKVITLNFRELNEYELAKKDHDLPTIVIEALDSKGNVVRNGYLTPFRAYRFQVSGTVNGEGDYGSTPVCNLPELARMVNGYSVIMPHAFTAIARWARGYRFGLDPYKIFGYDSVAEKWLKATVEWLRTK